MKRFIEKITNMHDSTLKKNIVYRFFLKVIGGILLALLIALATNHYFHKLDSNKNNKEKVEFINSLCLGTNMEYIHNTLGEPIIYYFNKYTSLEDCIYKGNGVFVRVFYKDKNAVGIFLTLTDHDKKGQYFFEKYNHLTNNLKLGEYTYAEVNEYGDYNQGHYNNFYSNGSASTIYMENYYYNSSGNYYDFYHCILHYGIYIDQQVISKDNEDNNTIYAFGRMGISYPNTIGMTGWDYQLEICSMLLDPIAFDHSHYDTFQEQYEQSVDSENYEDMFFYPEKEYVNYFGNELSEYFNNQFKEPYNEENEQDEDSYVD